MKKIAALVMALMLTMCAQALAAPVPSAESSELAVKVQQRASQVNTLRAEFVRQSDYVAMGSDGASQVMGSGQLFWGKPMNLRLEQHNPSHEIIIADGASVWWVRPERSRADSYPVDRFSGSLLSLLDVLSGMANINEKFMEVAVTDQDRSSSPREITLVLKPREARADLDRLVLWLDEGSYDLRGFKFSNVVGDTTMYRFSQVEINPGLPAGTFTYTPPDTYKINIQR